MEISIINPSAAKSLLFIFDRTKKMIDIFKILHFNKIDIRPLHEFKFFKLE